MQTAARNQIRLILDDLISNGEQAFSDRVEEIYIGHAAKGYLKSGATVKIALRAVEEISGNMLPLAIDQVSPVAKDFDAFAMISESFDRYWSRVALRIDDVALKASGRPPTVTQPDSVMLATRHELEAIRIKLTRRLEIHRFGFIHPSEPLIPMLEISKPKIAADHRKGGRPPAEFWDDMWAAIATALYDGTLIPKTQADVERAMADWIESNGHNAAGSTVRARARRLWDRVSATEE